MALQSDDIELVAVNDPFITTDYMVNLHLSLSLSRICIYINVYMRVPVHFIFSLKLVFFVLFNCATGFNCLLDMHDACRFPFQGSYINSDWFDL